MMPAGNPEAYGIPPEAMMAGMDSALAAGPPPPGPGPGNATPSPSSEGGMEEQVIATLAEENAQLRSLLGLGPDDPIPAPAEPSGAAPLPSPGAQPIPGP